MKRVLKFSLYGILGLLALFVLAAVLIPVLFKDEINARVKKEINEQVEAVVDYEDFGLSLFSQFPYLSIQLEGLKVSGKDVFARDTLLNLDELQVAVNIMNVIRGEKLEIQKIYLDRPRINAIVLADGRANWDIAKPDTTPDQPDTTTSEFAIALKKITIEQADIKYDDRQSKMMANIRKLNFSGAGDLTTDVFDFETKTGIDSVFFSMDGLTYANNLSFAAKVDINIDQKNSSYTFRENEFKINDLKLAFDGNVRLPEDSSIAMDITFKAIETQFRNILSLVPGVYTKDFEQLKTEGTLALDGKVKGKLIGERYPEFLVNLKIANGFLQYPDLPAPVKNIQVDVTASNATPNLETTEIHLNKFHAELENNPIDAKAHVVGLSNPMVDASVKARVQLERLTRIFPIEDIIMKGDLSIDAEAKGKMLEEAIPAFRADVNLKYGYLKSKEFPSALENMTLQVKASSQIGSMTDTQIDVQNFHAEIDQEPLDLKLFLRNLDDPDYKIDLKGSLDFAKLTKIYPLEDMTLSGKMLADLHTAGKLSVAEAQKYDQLDAAGSIKLSNVKYTAKDIEHPITISDAQLDFTNFQMNLTRFDSQLGKSDVQLTGQVENYIGYAFSGQKLRGKLNLKSKLLDVNEWLSDDSEAVADTATEEPMEAPQIPDDLDLVFVSTINRLLYDTYDIKNFTGNLTVRDQKLLIEEVGFDLLGGRFLLAGLYDSRNINQPLYKLNLKVDSLQIQKAFAAFSLLQKYVPAAKFAEGVFGTTFNLGGALTRTMEPVLNSINADGLALLMRTIVKELPVLNQLSSVTKLNQVKDVRINNTKLAFAIRDGRFFVEPFDIKLPNGKMVVGGSNALDGGLDYTVNLDMPAPAITQNAAGALSNLSGREVAAGERIKLPLQVGGTFLNPKITGVGKGAKDQIKETVKEEFDKAKEKIKDEVNKKVDEAKDRAREEADKVRREAEDRARLEADKLRNDAELKKREAEAKARQEADKLKQEAEKRKKEEEERLKKEAEKKLKDKLKFPK